MWVYFCGFFFRFSLKIGNGMSFKMSAVSALRKRFDLAFHSSSFLEESTC